MPLGYTDMGTGNAVKAPSGRQGRRLHRLSPWISGLVSTLAVVFIVAHMIWPTLAIDATTIALLLIVLLPWILPYIRSVELPGGALSLIHI